MESLFNSSNRVPPFVEAAGIGVLAGMRSMSALAVASDKLSRGHASLPTPLKFLTMHEVTRVLKFLAAGEMAADKLPTMPNRTSPLALLGRVLSGAVAGAALCAARKCNVVTGALIAGATALAATYGSYYLRQKVEHSFHIPDRVVGAIEDALTASGGYGMLKLSDTVVDPKGLLKKVVS